MWHGGCRDSCNFLNLIVNFKLIWSNMKGDVHSNTQTETNLKILF